jgi:hypothetical protein
MNKQSTEAEATGENPQVNERLWQTWLWKGRQQDKLRAKRIRQFFQVVLAMTFAAAVLQHFLR